MEVVFEVTYIGTIRIQLSHCLRHTILLRHNDLIPDGVSVRDKSEKEAPKSSPHTNKHITVRRKLRLYLVSLIVQPIIASPYVP